MPDISDNSHNLQIEKNILTLFLITDFNIQTTMVLELEAQDFYNDDYRAIFIIIERILQNNGKLEPFIIETELKNNNYDISKDVLQDILLNADSVDFYNKENYIELLKRYSLLRKLSNARERLAHLGPDKTVQDLILSVDEIISSSVSYNPVSTLEHVCGDDFQKRIEELIKNPKEMLGIKTCLNFYDTTFDGIVPTLLTLIGGRPGSGKSALGENLAYGLSVINQRPTLMIDTETNRSFVEDRLLSIVSGIDYNDIIHGKINHEEVVPFFELLNKSPFYYFYMPSLDTKQLNLICKKYKKAFGIETVIIDFLGSAEDGDNMYMEVGRKVKDMKNIANQFDLGFVVLQQLKREQVDANSGKNVKEVSLSHFVQSDMSVWYADAVGGLRMPTTVEKGKYQCNRMFDVPKNRFGNCEFSWPLKFDGSCMRFFDIPLF
jgi:replicative DNA helicase